MSKSVVFLLLYFLVGVLFMVLFYRKYGPPRMYYGPLDLVTISLLAWLWPVLVAFVGIDMLMDPKDYR